MKKEVNILPDGSFQEAFYFIQHRCECKDGTVSCAEYGEKIGRLFLHIEWENEDEELYEKQIEVKFCPFCGYSPK